MAKTSAERQAVYRAGRSEAGENGERRINMFVSTAAALALNRLAKYEGVTKREMLERVLISAQEFIASEFEPDSEEWNKFFDCE